MVLDAAGNLYGMTSHGGAFGHGTRGFVRLCFATDESTLHEAAVRIRRYAESLATRGALHG